MYCFSEGFVVVFDFCFILVSLVGLISFLVLSLVSLVGLNIELYGSLFLVPLKENTANTPLNTGVPSVLCPELPR